MSPRYKKFFDHPDNIYTKSSNNIDCLLRSSEGGLLLFNTYLKNFMANNLNSREDFVRSNEVVSIILELYEKHLISEEYNTSLILLVDVLLPLLRPSPTTSTLCPGTRKSTPTSPPTPVAST